jgi:hypothetical protein
MPDVQIRLGDGDRARLDCKEWLDIDFLDTTVEDLEIICAETGIDIDDWPACLNPKVPFTVMPEANARRRSPAWRNRVVIWLALRQAGHDVTWAEAGRVRTLQIQLRSVPEPPKDGADPEPSDSPNSDSDTTRSSATSIPE